MSTWTAAKRAAAKVVPAPEWRTRLAKALRDASGARFVGVYTCPPDEILDGVHSVYPEEMNDVLVRVAREVLPRIAWTRHGQKNPDARSGTPYFPLDYENGDGTLRSLLQPLMDLAGVQEMIHVAFLAEKQVVGGAALWLPKKRGAQAHLAPLADVARTASDTLERVLALARGCAQGANSQPILALEVLTARELQIARLAARGMTDLNIATKLGISEQTVGAHMRRIFLKLRINSRMQLARDARLQRASPD